MYHNLLSMFVQPYKDWETTQLDRCKGRVCFLASDCLLITVWGFRASFQVYYLFTLKPESHGNALILLFWFLIRYILKFLPNDHEHICTLTLISDHSGSL